MSFEAMAWASKQKTGSAGAKLVLLMLADHANGHTGQCNPRHKVMAAVCEMTVETLKKHIANLEACGFIEIIPQYAEGVQLPNHYVLNIEGGGGNFSCDESKNYTQGGYKNSPPNNQEVKPVTEPVNLIAAEEPPATTKKPAKRASQLPADFEPDETGKALARELGIMQGELAQFRDYHTAKGTTMKDWQAGWRTWVRNAAKFARSRAPSTSSRPVLDDGHKRDYGKSGKL